MEESKGTRERGSEGARERGSEGTRERGSEGGRHNLKVNRVHFIV